jgi:hypothetical protein
LQAAAPDALKAPAAQLRQVEIDVAPTAAEYLPAAQLVHTVLP